MAFLKLSLSCLVVLLVILPCHGHGGSFHEYPSTPEERNFIRYKVGTCNKWVLPTQQSNAANASGVMVSGPATLWTYRYKNCSDSTSICVEVNLTLSDGGKPAVGLNISGYSHVASCASGGGAKYMLNASATTADELRHSYIWFHDAITNNSGRIWGQGANDGDLNTSPPSGIASYILYAGNNSDPIACCDFTLTGAKNTKWSSLLAPGVDCSKEDGHGSSNSSSNGTSSTTSKNSGNSVAANTLQLLALVALVMYTLF